MLNCRVHRLQLLGGIQFGSVFDVINMLKRNMVARAAVHMIDGDQAMVT